MTGTTTEPSPPSSPPPPDARQGPALPHHRDVGPAGGSWLVFALLVVAFVFLLVEGLGSSLDYFDTVDQAFAHRASLGTQTFRLEGTVVPGTIRSTSTGSDFTICEGPNVVHVANTGSPPQLFQARIPVVVVGHFTSDTSTDFVSSSILVKHSATYTAQYPGRVKVDATGPAC